ncbi:TPA: hypothetical protein NQN76_002908 [Legionella pneumophila]|nr:hypothetical protein [Legionella pneumophila]
MRTRSYHRQGWRGRRGAGIVMERKRNAHLRVAAQPSCGRGHPGTPF